MPTPAHLRLQRRLLWPEGEAWTEVCSEDDTAYGVLWHWLPAGLPERCLRHGTEVITLRYSHASITVELADGARHSFALVLCVDGGRGTGRAWVEAALARYAQQRAGESAAVVSAGHQAGRRFASAG